MSSTQSSVSKLQFRFQPVFYYILETREHNTSSLLYDIQSDTPLTVLQRYRLFMFLLGLLRLPAPPSCFYMKRIDYTEFPQGILYSPRNVSSVPNVHSIIVDNIIVYVEVFSEEIVWVMLTESNND